MSLPSLEWGRVVKVLKAKFWIRGQRKAMKALEKP